MTCLCATESLILEVDLPASGDGGICGDGCRY